MLIRSLLASTAIVLALGAAAPVVSADDTTAVETTPDIDNRRDEMNSAMETWHARVEERRAETDSSDDTLDSAWNEVEAATAENWDDASDAFDRAMADLEETWDDVTDDDPDT
jgi:hypothetical protein